MGDQDHTKKPIGHLLSVLVFLGWFLLILSVIASMAILSGFTTVDQFSVRGTSGIRSIAATAVLGCISAALGYIKEE